MNVDIAADFHKTRINSGFFTFIFSFLIHAHFMIAGRDGRSKKVVNRPSFQTLSKYQSSN